MDAAFDLLLKRDIDSIWTQEIIRSAGVHKSTFYSHYRDKYALLEAAEEIAAEALYPYLERITLNMLGDNPDRGRLFAAYEDLSACIFENKRLFQVVLQSQSGYGITMRIISELENIWKASGIADPDSRNISYLINGAAYVIIGTIDKWLKRGCIESREEFTLLVNASGEGMRHAFYML